MQNIIIIINVTDYIINSIMVERPFYDTKIFVNHQYSW